MLFNSQRIGTEKNNVFNTNWRMEAIHYLINFESKTEYKNIKL